MSLQVEPSVIILIRTLLLLGFADSQSNSTKESTCPNGWIPSRVSKRCLYVSFKHKEIHLPWFSALTRCSELNPLASLVSVRNEAEQSEIKELANGRAVHLGGIGFLRSRVWTDSSPATTYENFENGQFGCFPKKPEEDFAKKFAVQNGKGALITINPSGNWWCLENFDTWREHFICSIEKDYMEKEVEFGCNENTGLPCSFKSIKPEGPTGCPIEINLYKAAVGDIPQCSSEPRNEFRRKTMACTGLCRWKPTCCVFPFVFMGRTYSQCIRGVPLYSNIYWCATSRDE